jgi:hypothetical protein
MNRYLDAICDGWSAHFAASVSACHTLAATALVAPTCYQTRFELTEKGKSVPPIGMLLLYLHRL